MLLNFLIAGLCRLPQMSLEQKRRRRKISYRHVTMNFSNFGNWDPDHGSLDVLRKHQSDHGYLELMSRAGMGIECSAETSLPLAQLSDPAVPSSTFLPSPFKFYKFHYVPFSQF